MLEPLVAPTIAEALVAAIDSAGAELHVSCPGIVQSYDAGKQKCDVKPVLMVEYADEDGNRQVEEHPVICDVPVQFQRSKTDGLTFPIAPGDTVLLVFSTKSLDVWLSVGGVVDPADPRHHSLSDAVAIPCVRSFAESLSDVSATACVLTAGTRLLLGSSSASQAAVLGTTYRSAEDTLLTALSAACTALATAMGLLAAVPVIAAIVPTAAACTASGTAATAVVTAITTFKSAASSYLSTKVALE